ncbi:MAG: heme o synthase [Phycisphaerales bacterium JB038]
MSRATSRDIPVAVEAEAEARDTLLSTYSELVKARLSSLVLLTTAAGFLVGGAGSLEWGVLCWTMLGTALAAASAATLNQVLEVERDRRMHRTRRRPLPRGVVSVPHAAILGVSLGVVGVVMLALFVNPLTAGLGAANILIYLLLYTPLKTRSTLNTLIGAICGAVPPVMGWTAATGSLAGGGWVLGGILFVWQIPHFLALAWMYREDYQRGGYRMLPVVDAEGRFTGPVAVLYCLALVPVSLLLTALGHVGWFYAVGALVLGLLFLVAAVRLRQRLDDRSARRLFLASIAYLPLLLLLIVLDRTPMAGGVQLSREPAAQAPIPAAMLSVEPLVGAVRADDSPTDPA